MHNKAPMPVCTLLIALIALIVAVAALMIARDSRQLALSTLQVEEGESLTLPVYDEERSQYGFLILCELEVTNAAGPAVLLTRLVKAEEGSGWLVALKGQTLAAVDLKPRLFLLDQPLRSYQENPRLLKEKWGTDRSALEFKLALPAGAGKKVRYGVYVAPYDSAGAAQAEMVLISLRLEFDNGKNQLFRRAYPVPPLTP
ncbi:MAG TPA: hypothetical protein PLG50_04070 [bacterium]|nr:hypothetical protein [bacterium]HQG44813.1 hypothetical protein [bacterium]HQJ63926.1 hypothetical protein [bacterium]